MRVIHVARKPLSEGNVASNVLKHGTGAINVDAIRIAGVWRDPNPRRAQDIKGGGWNSDRERAGFTKSPHSGGRWPANLILQHRPGCECVGTKEVKGRLPREGGGLRFNDAAEGWTRKGCQSRMPRPGLADKDGKETVADWKCVPGCPVAALNEQTSRFFKQVQEK